MCELYSSVENMGLKLFHTVVFLITFYTSNIIWNHLENDDQFCTIETVNGRIRGKQNRTLLDEKLFFSFRGIPFAKPPINDLRFKAPQINDHPWDGTLDAFEFGNDCFQHVTGKTFEGHEDCLYLNVYVPTNSTSIDTNAKLPVIFFIYGGRYVTGSSNAYAPDFFLDENVIVVTSNYRLGPFGFLALKLPEYSGNMGLKDQSLALRWVHENIEYFGGDKHQITIGGHSSGGVSAHLHLISPQSNHLFQRAFMLSGTALYPSLMQEPGQNDILYKLADELGHSVTNEHELVDFIKEIDAQLLLQSTVEPILKPANGTKEISHGWTIVVEDKNAINPFLTESPFNILTNPNYESNIDAIFSSSPRESVVYDEQLQPELLKILDEVFEFDLPLVELTIDFKSDVYKKISKRLRDFYFGGKPITEENLSTVYTMATDLVFLYGIDLSARIQAKKSKARTIFCKFTAENDWNLSVRKRKESNSTIVFDNHTDMLHYVMWFSFDTPNEVYQSLKQNSLPRSIVKNVAEFFANFVKFGYVMKNNKPVEFNTPQSNLFKYYDITNDGIFVKTDDRGRFEFWNDLLNEFKGHWNITFDFRELN